MLSLPVATRSLLRRLDRLSRAEAGATAVETALGLLIVLLLMVGIVDLARYTMLRNSLQSAVQVTARQAQVAVPTYTDSVCDQSQVEAEVAAWRDTLVAMVRERALTLDAGPVAVSVDHDAGYRDRCVDLRLHVEAVGQFSFLLPGFPASIPIRAYQSVALRQNAHPHWGDKVFLPGN
ncbi:MAG: pilus assembly protein [Alphaproteobacteria bacterium]|nr:pilus assembly protein [Alphaproteobacteria bacterium]